MSNGNVPSMRQLRRTCAICGAKRYALRYMYKCDCGKSWLCDYCKSRSGRTGI